MVVEDKGRLCLNMSTDRLMRKARDMSTRCCALFGSSNLWVAIDEPDTNTTVAG